MRQIELWTADGHFVAVVEVLPFADDKMPEVVCWGIRTFVVKPETGRSPGARWRYRECFAFATATPSPGLDVTACRGCGKPLDLANLRVADCCPCNSPRGVNHGLVPKDTCTCPECDPAQTGSTRQPAAPEVCADCGETAAAVARSAVRDCSARHGGPHRWRAEPRLGPASPPSETEFAEAIAPVVDRGRRLVEDLSDRKTIERQPLPPPPVDRSATTLSDGSPVTKDHRELRPDGQQKGYVVLSAEERAKGFVRPVRRSYRHVGRPIRHPGEKLDSNSGGGCGWVTTMGQALAETYARDPSFYSGTFCASCSAHFPVGADGEFVWVDAPDQRVGT